MGGGAIIGAITYALAAKNTMDMRAYAKKQEKLAESSAEQAAVEQAKQKEEAKKRRIELVNQQREAVDLSKHYSTKTKERGIYDSGLNGKLTEDVLG